MHWKAGPIEDIEPLLRGMICLNFHPIKGHDRLLTVLASNRKCRKNANTPAFMNMVDELGFNRSYASV